MDYNILELEIILLKKGISKKELANKMEIDYNTLLNKINKITDFKVEEIKKIKELLELSSEDLRKIFLI